ncbi:MAG: class I SAM-dependent methyltransferase [Planctomycetota bacterium]
MTAAPHPLSRPTTGPRLARSLTTGRAATLPTSLHPPFHHYRCLIQRRLTDALANAAQLIPNDSTLIDLGCGDLRYKPLFTPRLNQYLGVDLPDNPDADLHYTDDFTAPLPNHTADAVLSTQVLEHVPCPADYLAEAKRLLKPNARLILTTHGTWQYHPHPRDLWRWTAEGLTQTLTDAGFQNIQTTGLLNLAATGVHLFQDGLYRRLPRIFRKPFFLACQLTAAAIDHKRPDPHNACVFLATATSTPA